MRKPDPGDIRYCIFDPTGNITALVETATDPSGQPAVASLIMERHPEVEQVGFVSYESDADGPDIPASPGKAIDKAQVSLRMAGGEFCGNATMCAAALFAMRRGLKGSATVMVKVSGATEPIKVALDQQAASEQGAATEQGAASEQAAARYFAAAASMPPAVSVGMFDFLPAPSDSGSLEAEAGGLQSEGADGISAMITLPLVKLEGIDHIIIEPDSGFYDLRDDSALAEKLLREWCGALGSDCLGMMFLDAGGAGDAIEAACASGAWGSAMEAAGILEDTAGAVTERVAAVDAGSAGAVTGSAAAADVSAEAGAPLICERTMTPLVYVPGADTMFWENSCASGSAAAGMYLAAKAGQPVDVTFREPAGCLRVECDPAAGTTILHGSARLLSEGSI